MYQPETYVVALLFMLLSMLCWGSWANAMKLCPGCRFQIFYWDYVGGVLLGSVGWGLTLGSHGGTGLTFLDEVVHAGASSVLLAGLAGMLFNVANLLLVAAIEIAGLAVAFPVGIGLALVIGAVSSYLIAPGGNPWLLFGGIALVLAAIVFDAVAHRLRERQTQAAGGRGIALSLAAGVLMGTFYPFVARSMAGPHAAGPYAASFFFAVGVVLCALPVNSLLMKRPLDGREPVSLAEYGAMPGAWHCWGLLGGAVWCTGAVLNFVASRAHIIGPAVSYSIGQGATMVSACWGVFIWKEFAAAPARSRLYLVWMFVCFVIGLTAVALAPVL
ncbi:MAG: GRP family sugar transporter [Acidobacteriaceae bacterium]